MISDRTKKYEGSEHELPAQTLELDELHHDVGMPAMAQALARCGHQSPHLPVGRRRAMAGGAALAVVAVRYRRWLPPRPAGFRLSMPRHSLRRPEG